MKLIQRLFYCCAISFCLKFSVSQAQQPRQVWSFSAKSNLYAPPLVADVHPSPGKEIIISDSEVRCLRCVSATGQQIWQAEVGWKKRLVSAAALSEVNKDGLRLLAIGNADGSLACLDASTGAVAWKCQAGVVEWGGGLWADLDGDRAQELIYATHHEGVVAFKADGQELWRYKNAVAEPALEIPCVPTGGDVDGDGKTEIFCMTTWGAFCLRHDGRLKWKLVTGDDFTASSVLTKDGLFTMSREDHYVWRLNTSTGAVQWKRAMAAGSDVYNGSALAVGDINGDDKPELVGSDCEGHIYAYSMEGTLLWIFSTRLPVHAAVTLGDVDGDRNVDVLAASGDHCLYGLDGSGREQWRFATELRLVGPATIDDIDADGKTEILVCGSDRTLRCLALGGHYDPALNPWPSRRHDVAQSGSNLGVNSHSGLLLVTKSLFQFGDFDQVKVREEQPLNVIYKSIMSHPRGWRCESPQATWGLYENKENGHTEKCLKTSGSCVIVSDHIPLPKGLQSVSAKVEFQGQGFESALLQWIGDSGVVGEKKLVYGSTVQGWRTLAVKDNPPHGARMAMMVLNSKGTESLWKKVKVNATILEPATISVLTNQVGYDMGAPKHFVVQTNLDTKDARFELVDQSEKSVLSGLLQNNGRIIGKYGQDWGYIYYSGKLENFDSPGKYRIRIQLDGKFAESWPFEIGKDVLWRGTARPAYRFFWYQRCGMEIPGFHAACHLDDAVVPDGKIVRDVRGGWHDAGDYNKYQNAPYVKGLARAYGSAAALFDALKPKDEEGFLDEILWGGTQVRRMITEDGSSFGSITSGYGFWGPPELETDNIPSTGDERPASSANGVYPGDHQAALARIAALLREKGAKVAEWTVLADRSLEYSLNKHQRGLDELSAAIDLFRATDDVKYAKLAKELFAGLALKPNQEPSAILVDVIRRYDSTFHEDHAPFLKEILTQKADALLALANNPFGVCTFGPPESPNFFGTPMDKSGWHVGTSSYLFESANLVALAYHYNPDIKYLDFIYDQFNWTLGMNPYNTSLMEGVGSFNLPSYHNRITFAGVPRGAVPGSLVNGVTWRAVGDDRPFLDLSGQDIPAFEPNECWLPHNTAYLNALAALMAAKTE
jgi:outer membrane protein assembly factor BamB